MKSNTEQSRRPRSNSFPPFLDENSLEFPSSPSRRYPNYNKWDASSTMHRLRRSLVGSQANLQSLQSEAHFGDSSSTPMSSGLYSINEQHLFDLERGHTNGSFKGYYTGYGHGKNNGMGFLDSPKSDPLSNYPCEYIHPTKNDSMGTRQSFSLCHVIKKVLHQIPAIALIAMFHLMIGIPFGVSYFPIGWRANASAYDTTSSNTNNDDAADLVGEFPLPGKEALGIRMFLFSTMLGQIAFTFASGFDNPIGLQMVENVPFCHSLAATVIRRVGYGKEALSTLFVLFGLSSIIVGIVFYMLGRLKLGRIIYFFPTHVLVGCIGGIGIFIAKTGVEVTIDTEFSFRSLLEKVNLLVVVLAFEIMLRILEQVTKDENGKSRYPLLSPVYFCMMTPIFYAVLWGFDVSFVEAENAGFLFPSMTEACTSTVDCDATSATVSTIWGIVFDGHLFDLLHIVDLTTVSWKAIFDAIPTIVALTLFSLIHVPINIPAFAISTDTEADMNKELIAHGYSNCFSGIFCGLQNYMAYTQSVLYDRSGGRGKVSGVAVAIVTGFIFLIGPTVASYIPRCMAGTLLLHVGIDLFLEGVYDSYGKFDLLEYSGIWLIAIIMTGYGMDAAMIAGVIAAVSTYAVQTITYLHPVRGHMTAVTLRSSRKNRGHKAELILDMESTGRSRILVVQLQGHLFFGNIAQLNDSINDMLSKGRNSAQQPWIVILDFSLVLGIDSSAAQALIKLKEMMRNKHSIQLCIFVSGSEIGFPCEFPLTGELSDRQSNYGNNSLDNKDEFTASEETTLLKKQTIFSGCHVCRSLDLSLHFAESALIAKQDIFLLDDQDINPNFDRIICKTYPSQKEEREAALQYLLNICPEEVEVSDVELLFSLFEREVFTQGVYLWRQGNSSDSAKLLLSGRLVALLENEAGTSELVQSGAMIGELGLVQGTRRMSSVQCSSDEAILYTINREAFEEISQTNPKVARYIDLICINYLANRVQHVSNRIFETRCLPI